MGFPMQPELQNTAFLKCITVLLKSRQIPEVLHQLQSAPVAKSWLEQGEKTGFENIQGGPQILGEPVAEARNLSTDEKSFCSKQQRQTLTRPSGMAASALSAALGTLQTASRSFVVFAVQAGPRGSPAKCFLRSQR